MTNEELQKRDFILFIDKSGSMSDPVKKNSKQTRWQAAEEATVALAGQCEKWDDDGITVILFSNGHQVHENVTGGKDLVKKIFTDNGPNGGTNTVGALKHTIDSYFAAKAKNAAEVKPLAIFVITDGIPDDEEALAEYIRGVAAKVDSDDEIRINFVQVGDNEHAKEFLVRLDTKLEAKRDIVNCKTEEELANHPTLADGVLSMLNDLAEEPVAVAENA